MKYLVLSLLLGALNVAFINSPALAKQPQTLAKLNCSHDQIAKYDDTIPSWVCADDDHGSEPPAFVIQDSSIIPKVVGSYAQIGHSATVVVVMTNTTHNENFLVSVLPQHLRGFDHQAVYYSNFDCTGDAYVIAPSLASGMARLRGVTYSIGADPLDNTKANRVMRGSGVGVDNTSSTNSRFEVTANNTAVCDGGISTTNATVIATEVMDLSDFTPPFTTR